MSRFGWDLPPGVTNRMIEEQCADGPCAVCALPANDCVCPECPTCGEIGNPECYYPRMNPFRGHGLRLSREQVIGRQKARVRRAADALHDEEMALVYLENDGDFSDSLDDNRG